MCYGLILGKHITILIKFYYFIERVVGIETCSNVCKKPLLCSDKGLINDDQLFKVMFMWGLLVASETIKP
jgi:hypothetical protein